MSTEYVLQTITSYDPRHVNVLTYSKHKILLEKPYHNNIQTTI